MLRQHTFVGMADETLALLQHSTRLYILNVANLSKDMFYQQVRLLSAVKMALLCPTVHAVVAAGTATDTCHFEKSACICVLLGNQVFVCKQLPLPFSQLDMVVRRVVSDREFLSDYSVMQGVMLC